jgi:phosphonate transport system ATP-binding protein
LSPLLKINHLNKTYPNGHQALKDISFEVEKGEFLAIIGLSGSGKSTLLRCINRLIEPTSGEILLNGQDVVKLSSEELRMTRQKIGMVFQQFNLIPRKSVLLNVLSGQLSKTPTLSSIFGVFSETQKKEAIEKLELVGLTDKAYVRADELSGGQQQRVAIARALMQDPEILLADEPVASLDPATSHNVMAYLKKANQEYGKTILCNLHFLSLVREYSTRILALKNGEIVYYGLPTEVDNAWFKKIYGEDSREVEIH